MSGLWRSNRYMKGTWHDDVLELHQKYGRIVRIAPNELSIVDEFAMKHLYGHGHNAKKTAWYKVWDPPNTAPQLFSELDKTYHAYLRKRVAGAYAMSSILKYEKYIQDCLDLLLWRLKGKAELGQRVDMAQWTNAFAFDVVGELAYGTQLGHLRTETDVNNLRANIFNIFFTLSNLGHFPGQAWIINNSLTQGLLWIVRVPPVFAKFATWSRDRVKDRMENQDNIERDDMLGHFCRMKCKDGSPAPLNEVLIEAMNLIGAGADTTSIGMRSCLHYLCKYPKYYRLVQDEVDNFYGANKGAEPITYLQTQQLPILQAVVKEATRLLPSIVFQLLRHAPDNFTVRGQYIPAGTIVGISPMAQNRDCDIFGGDADEFRPERWLEDRDKAGYMDTSLMTFGGSGPRMCVGKNIALVEIHKFVAQLLYYFDVEMVDPKNPWRITTYWFAYQHDQHMKICLRPGRTMRRPDGLALEKESA
ncbi:hypothetical protein CLAIMM_06048 [Cladophialophora immunda]|nr:hypothetical protein CLAIMM_06048 [Cladophialophora immunda]